MSNEKKDVLGIIIESEDACTSTRAFQKPHLMEDAQDTFSRSFCAEGSKKECSYDGAGNCGKKFSTYLWEKSVKK